MSRYLSANVTALSLSARVQLRYGLKRLASRRENNLVESRLRRTVELWALGIGAGSLIRQALVQGSA